MHMCVCSATYAERYLLDAKPTTHSLSQSRVKNKNDNSEPKRIKEEQMMAFASSYKKGVYQKYMSQINLIWLSDISCSITSRVTKW